MSGRSPLRVQSSGSEKERQIKNSAREPAQGSHDVKPENHDPAWGHDSFTDQEMSKPIDRSRTQGIVERSIKAIETLHATGDIYDRTALTEGAREKLMRNNPKAQPSSTDLLHQKMDEMGARSASLTGRALIDYSIPDHTGEGGIHNGEVYPV